MTQQTLKHRDWVKIIDKRHREISLKKKKTIIDLLPSYLICSAAIGTSLFILSSFIKSNTRVELSIQEKQVIQQYFSKKLRVGKWHLSHLDFNSNNINIYINLPELLPIEEPYLSKYIQQTLCPSSEELESVLIKNHNLSINLFSGPEAKIMQSAKCNV